MYKNLYKKNYRYLVLFMVTWILSGVHVITVKAQTVDCLTVTNQVLDLYGNPVPGVEVSVKGTNTSVTTLEDGTFVLDYAVDNVLTFSREGFLYRESKVTDTDIKKGVLVHLQGNLIDNLPTIPGPYGDDMDKASYLGSASTVSTEQLTTTMGTTIIPALTGRITGLNVSQVRGARSHFTSANYTSDLIGLIPVFGTGIYSDNSEFSLASRGVTPIVIVDGIQREFYALDPEVIESVSLQKDALSTMFLGMQSSRGALIITTKKPTQNALYVSFTGRVGVNSPIKMPKPLDSYQYAYLLNEALSNDGKLSIYAYDDFAKYRNGTNHYTHPNVNWYDALYDDNTISQAYNLNVSGGNKVAQYFVSLGYMREEGAFFTSSSNSYNTNLDYQRYLITSKVNVNITDDFTANIMLIGRVEDGNQPAGNGTGYSDLLNTIYTTPNSAYPVRNPNGSWGGNISFTNNLMSQTMNSGYLRDNARDILGILNLTYDFDKQVKGLSVQLLGGITTQTRTFTERSKRSAVYSYGIDDNGNAVYTQFSEPTSQANQFYTVSNYQDMYGQLAVNYHRQWGQHGLKATLKGDTRTLINNYDLPEIPSNIMANVSYDYGGKYFAQAALTESYYNRYAPDNRWGTFYAFGLGWDISRENFMHDEADWLNQLKLRAVYGRTGNGITNSGYYTWSQTYSNDGTAAYPLGTSQTTPFYVRENQPLANYNITWEKADKRDIGLDLAVLNNRIRFVVDYYNDYYYDLLQPRGKNIELMGATYPYENIGKLSRYGTELTLTYQNCIGRFNCYVSGNWSYEQSKIKYIDEQDMPYDYLYRTGNPLGAYFGLVADGFLTAEDIANGYPVMEGFSNIQPGDVKYVDKNDDGIIDEFDSMVIGGDKPLSYFGMDVGFEYRGFEFSMLWQGVYNRDIYLNDRTFTEGFQQINQHYGQAYEHLLNRWTPETAATATFPRLSAGGNNYNNGNNWGSSLWVKSGNFIRLKNMHVAYNIPESFSRRYLWNLRFRIFVDGQNLWTQAACDLVDPEVSFTNYPIQRNVNIGINVKF